MNDRDAIKYIKIMLDNFPCTIELREVAELSISALKERIVREEKFNEEKERSVND